MSELWEGIAKKVRSDLAPVILALVITSGFFYSLEYLSKHSLPESSRDAVLAMLETLKTVWILAMGYFFGTTASSARKTEAIVKAEAVKE